MAKELALDDTGRMKLVRTNDRHMPIPMNNRVKPEIELDDSTTMRYDNNNVDIDVEMASLAKNSLLQCTGKTDRRKIGRAHV